MFNHPHALSSFSLKKPTAKSFSHRKYLAKDQEKLKHNTWFTEWIHCLVFSLYVKPLRIVFNKIKIIEFSFYSRSFL